MAGMTPEELADLVIRKKQLDEELKAVREVIKRANIDLPFALQRGDNIVVVKKPAYVNGMPSTEVIPLLGLGCSS
jgi:hypothetical protein